MHAFILDGIPLRLKVEDIYFITILSQQGEVVNCTDRGLGEGMTMYECIVVYFLLNIDKVGSKFPISAIQILSIKVIILFLLRIAGLGSLH